MSAVTTESYLALSREASRIAAACVIELQTIPYHLTRGFADQTMWRRKADEIMGAVELAAQVAQQGNLDYAYDILSRTHLPKL
jgi:hypothetical protein